MISNEFHCCNITLIVSGNIPTILDRQPIAFSRAGSSPADDAISGSYDCMSYRTSEPYIPRGEDSAGTPQDHDALSHSGHPDTR